MTPPTTVSNLISSLQEEVRELRLRVDELSSQPFTVFLTSVPDPYKLHRDVPVLIQPTGDDFVATLSDAGISATGDTVLDAVSNLKDVIVKKFQFLGSIRGERLGKGPKHQFTVLQSLIQTVARNRASSGLD